MSEKMVYIGPRIININDNVLKKILVVLVLGLFVCLPYLTPSALRAVEEALTDARRGSFDALGTTQEAKNNSPSTDLEAAEIAR